MFAAQLTPSYFPIVGGTETMVRDLAVTLGRHGTISEVITLCDTEKWQSSRIFMKKTTANTQVIVWPSYPLWKTATLTRVHYLPSLTPRLTTYLAAFDVLHYHDESDLSFPLSLRRMKKPKVFSCHSLPPLAPWFSKHTLARELFVRSADLFHVFSRRDRINLVSLGVSNDRIRIIPNGVDVSLFTPRPEETSREIIRIVWVGRISREKGVITLLRAFNRLKDEFGNIELMIGGRAWDIDADYYNGLIELVRRKNVRRAHFVGFVNNLPAFLREADIYVLPSLCETFPIASLEAMASGLPIVASAVGSVPDIIVDNKTGHLVVPGSEYDLVEKIRTLIKNPKSRRRMGRMARKRAEQQFSLDNMSSLILKTYRELT